MDEKKPSITNWRRSTPLVSRLIRSGWAWFVVLATVGGAYELRPRIEIVSAASLGENEFEPTFQIKNVGDIFPAENLRFLCAISAEWTADVKAPDQVSLVMDFTGDIGNNVQTVENLKAGETVSKSCPTALKAGRSDTVIVQKSAVVRLTVVFQYPWLPFHFSKNVVFGTRPSHGHFIWVEDDLIGQKFTVVPN